MPLDQQTKKDMDAIFERATGSKPQSIMGGGLLPIQERIAQLKTKPLISKDGIGGLKSEGSIIDTLKRKTTDDATKQLGEDIKSIGTDIKETGTGIVDVLKERGGKIKESFQASKAGEQTLGESIGQTAVNVVRTPFDIAGEIIKGGVKGVLSQDQEEKLKSGVGEVVGKAIETVGDWSDKYENLKQTNPVLAGGINIVLGRAPETVLDAQEAYTKYQELKETNPRAARNLEALFGVAETALDVATVGAGKVGTTALKEGAEQGLKIAGKQAIRAGEQIVKGAATAGTESIEIAKRGASFAKKKLGTPEPTIEGAVGQVIQGKSTDIAKAQKAIQSVDTKGVKTYKDLAGKLEDKKKELINIVDSELSKDTTIYPLEQLATKATTKSGKEVATNYVEKSLKDLKEFYEVTGDNVKASEIDDLITKGSFTRKEVNDIARTYGEEFGSKAFSKTGDPLTSVNAQAFENTRKGLKSVARQGIGGKEAQLADESLSAIYNTEKLVKRNIEAVQKLQQRINERGLLEKAGHIVAKYGDILTGGTIRGLVGGLLPRGAGYKVLNALDLEEQLSRNLDVINRAITAKSDDALVKAVQEELLAGNVPKIIDDVIKDYRLATNIKKSSPAITKKASIPKVSNKSVKLSSTLSTLEKEAKKYKSAEEFVEFNKETSGLFNEKVLPGYEHKYSTYRLKDFLGELAPKQYKDIGDINITLVEPNNNKYGIGGKFPSYTNAAFIIPKNGNFPFIVINKELKGVQLKKAIIEEVEHALTYRKNPRFVESASNLSPEEYIINKAETAAKVNSERRLKDIDSKIKSQLTDIWKQANKK